MSSGKGCAKLAALLAAILILPIIIGAISTVWFLRGRSAASDASGASATCAGEAPDSACAVVAAAFEAAAAADSASLATRLADPAWLDRLPPAATATPRERGRYYVRVLLGEVPGSLEELRSDDWSVRPVATRTELDGRSATVEVEVRGGSRALAERHAVSVKRSGDGWRIAPPEVR